MSTIGTLHRVAVVEIFNLANQRARRLLSLTIELSTFTLTESIAVLINQRQIETVDVTVYKVLDADTV